MDVLNGRPGGYEDEEYRFRECYEFNKAFDEIYDDDRCIHCRYFLTTDCPHIDEFIGEDDE